MPDFISDFFVPQESATMLIDIPELLSVNSLSQSAQSLTLSLQELQTLNPSQVSEGLLILKPGGHSGHGHSAHKSSKVPVIPYSHGGSYHHASKSDSAEMVLGAFCMIGLVCYAMFAATDPNEQDNNR